MRILLLSVILLFSTVGIAQNSSGIPWSAERELTWDDFEKRVGQGGFYKAFTYSGIRYTVDSPGDTIEIFVEAYFLEDQSWVYREFQTERLLNHEQRHFDIAEIYARRMRAELQKYEVHVMQFVSHDFGSDIKRTFNQLYDEMEQKQKDYDFETEHGLEDTAQARWNAWIDDQLKNVTP